MNFHFMVRQSNRKTEEFTEEDGRKFEVTTFSGSNERAGMFGETTGCIVNLVAPEKRTVLFSRYYYSDGSRGNSSCEVSASYIDGIVAFAEKHKITLYGNPETMLSTTDGHFFTLAEYSDDFIELHPEDPAYKKGSE